MKIKAPTREAYKLLHEGSEALSQVETNGIRVDVDYLEKIVRQLEGRIGRLEERLKDHEVFALWKERFKRKANLGSRQQLSAVLFEDMGYKSDVKSEKTGQYKMDEEVLSGINNPFVKNYLRLSKLKKCQDTYLKNIQNELEGDRIHPSFNLHTVVTYRSSCGNPNLQNMPIRDPIQGEIIRRCFIPSEGNVLVEIDYGGIEVRISAAYNKDPTLISYINDSSKDMHRDMASECYCVEADHVSKMMRYCSKNQFVFPEFYGSYYLECAKNLWASIDQYNFEYKGKPLKEHLRKKKIKELGNCDPKIPACPHTFEYHIKKVERNFWDERFSVYKKWKENWWEQYLKRGWIQMLTGFVVSGVHGRNDIINYGIQGSAFHCLLWSLIRLNRWLVDNRMKTMIVGQIHDSIILDVHKSELSDVLTTAKRIMTEDIRKTWKWLVVPLEVECELSETSWYEKREISI